MRWRFKWGLTVAGPQGPVEITDHDYAEYMHSQGLGKAPPEEPEIPEAGLPAWGYFWRLNQRRQPGFESVAPLTYTEIRNWSEMTRTVITPEDVEYITTIDDAFIAGVSEGRERQRIRRESREKAEQALRKR